MTTETRESPKVARWGWGILLAVTALLILNGLAWLFVGPDVEVDEMATALRMHASEFEQAHPAAVDFVARQTRQVAVWYIAFGLLALFVILAGSRRSARWAWKAGWVLFAAPAAVGLVQLVGGGASFAYAMLALAGITLIGQLLARADLEYPGDDETSGSGRGDKR
ncbi:MAG TPA: hypothetical protein VF148_04840 [Acidimicrobiia bacterium]